MDRNPREWDIEFSRSRDPSSKDCSRRSSALDVTEHERDKELRRGAAYLAEAHRLRQTASFGRKLDGGEIIWSDESEGCGQRFTRNLNWLLLMFRALIL
jgi:hypothetical protein